MSISLHDKVEAIYELKKFLNGVRLTDAQTKTVDVLLAHTLRENKRLALHEYTQALDNVGRKLLDKFCPTFVRWVQQ